MEGEASLSGSKGHSGEPYFLVYHIKASRDGQSIVAFRGHPDSFEGAVGRLVTGNRLLLQLRAELRARRSAKACASSGESLDGLTEKREEGWRDDIYLSTDDAPCSSTVLMLAQEQIIYVPPADQPTSRPTTDQLYRLRSAPRSGNPSTGCGGLTEEGEEGGRGDA